MSDGMSDGYRMEREARDAEDREEQEQAEFDLRMGRSMRNLRDQLSDYLSTRGEYFHMDNYQQKLYPWKKAELKEKLKEQRLLLGLNLDRLSGMLKEKL